MASSEPRRSAALFSALCLLLASLLGAGQPVQAALTCPTAIAHRGNAVYGGPSENSLGAFTTTFDAGGKWIETDVRFTSDNVPVLMHDSTVDRTTTGSGFVSTMTSAQFTALTMNDGEHPPTLDQTLELVRARPDRRLIMEIKTSNAGQDQIVLDKLRGLENQVYVNAFAAELASIQKLKVEDPLLHISLVTYNPVFPVPVGISGEDMEYTYVTADRVAQLHAAGMVVRAWVPNNATAWEALREMGVDAIMTNSTAAYVKWVVAQCGAPPPDPTDQTPPTVTRSTPENGATVTAMVQVTGQAADDVGVDSVSLLVDDEAVATSPAGVAGAVSFEWNSGTVPNGTHTLRLQARDAAGNSTLSDPVSLTVQNDDEEAPTPPAAVHATWGRPSKVDLTWSGATDDQAVTGYRVYRGEERVVDLGPNARSWTDAGVANLTKLSYVVTALDAAGHESAPSGPATVDTGDDTAPTVPSVSVELTAPDAVKVSWNGSTDNAGVLGTRVYRDGKLIATVDSPTSSFVDNGLDDGVSYSYSVVAFDAAGNSSADSARPSVTTPDRTAPGKPGTVTAVSGGQNVALTWTAATDNVAVTNYVVHRDGATLVTLPGTARTYNDTGLDTTTPHAYYVTALDAAGLESPATNVVNRSFADTTAPTAPTGLARTITAFTVKLTWKAATDKVGVTGYTVYRAGVAVGTTTTATTYSDSAAPPGKTYSYTVRARDAAGNLSAASNAVSATLPIDKTAPTTPSGLKATAGAVGTRQVVLTWKASTDNAGVTGYYVFRGNAKYKSLGNVLTFTDAGLTAGRKYSYKVYALDASGNWSSPSATVSATAR